MVVREIVERVYYVGVPHHDRRLFDALIPLPDGTSYNAYLIKDEKTVLIDTVDPMKEKELLHNLETAGVDRIDYIVSNHTEQDHSGAIPTLLELYPEAKVVTNPKCRELLQHHLHIPEHRFITVQDGDRISIGSMTLEFIIAPWVHWPDTMFTYLKEKRILFTCDFLASHLASGGLFVEDEAVLYNAAKRYYAEIMMPFRRFVSKHLERVTKLEIDIIAPSHGPLHNRPEFILNLYQEWCSEDVKNAVVMPYVSMHGSTENMAKHLAERLAEQGVEVRMFNLTVTDLGSLAMALIDAATLVLATPTVLSGPHPLAVYATYLVNALRPKLRFASILCSYGWGGKTLEIVKDMLRYMPNLKFLTPVIVRGLPDKEDYARIDKLADEIVEKHKQITGG